MAPLDEIASKLRLLLVIPAVSTFRPVPVPVVIEFPVPPTVSVPPFALSPAPLVESMSRPPLVNDTRCPPARVAVVAQHDGVAGAGVEDLRRSREGRRAGAVAADDDAAAGVGAVGDVAAEGDAAAVAAGDLDRLAGPVVDRAVVDHATAADPAAVDVDRDTGRTGDRPGVDHDRRGQVGVEVDAVAGAVRRAGRVEEELRAVGVADVDRRPAGGRDRVGAGRRRRSPCWSSRCRGPPSRPDVVCSERSVPAPSPSTG